MRILGLVCSPRREGNTEILVQKALESAAAKEAETTLISVSRMDIKPCDGCYSCQKTGRCHIKDDMQKIYETMLSADGMILGTPVYFWTVAGQAKILMDRTFALRYPSLRLINKVAGAIVVSGGSGMDGALTVLERFFLRHHMFVVDPVVGKAREKGKIVNDKYALNAAVEMGAHMVSLVQQQFKFPPEFATPLYKTVEKKYNVNI